jgi:hypothetical protein
MIMEFIHAVSDGAFTIAQMDLCLAAVTLVCLHRSVR